MEIWLFQSVKIIILSRTSTIINILTQALSTEEITEEMSAELQDAANNMETAKQTIVDLCDNPDATKSITDIEELKNILQKYHKRGKK